MELAEAASHPSGRLARVARGRVSSVPDAALVERIRRYVESGIRDIKLTGQDTAAYGMDLGSTLADLLNAVTSIEGDFRMRVGMMDPLTALPILEALVEAYRRRRSTSSSTSRCRAGTTGSSRR